jgi:hypothetical protein
MKVQARSILRFTCSTCGNETDLAEVRAVRPCSEHDTWRCQRCAVAVRITSIGWRGRLSERERSIDRGDECPQGQTLVHHLDNGFTAMQWWDRTQGDTRFGCNSTFLAEGEHDFETMLRLFAENFPEQHARITAVAPITLVET